MSEKKNDKSNICIVVMDHKIIFCSYILGPDTSGKLQ